MDINSKGDHQFHPVKTSRGVKVRGLWKRNGSFYVQTTLLDTSTGIKKNTRIRLEKARTVDEARAAMEKVKEQAALGEIKTGGNSPTFEDYRQHYIERMRSSKQKAEKTLHNEENFLKQWQKFIGADYRIAKITPLNILAYRSNCVGKLENSTRTANLHVRALKEMLKLAKVEGIITKLPFDDIKPLPEETKVKPLLTIEEIFAMGSEALRNHDRTGVDYANYLAFLLYSGARCSETLLLTWQHIDFDNGQVVFSSDISKGDTRRIDMGRNLKNLLLTMKANKGESPYLFPSPRADAPVTSFKKIMQTIRKKTGTFFHFHLTRHFFISQCVMSGIDYLTIASWVGHKDGGILIGKTYGHLDRKHMKAQAEKLRI